MDYTALAIVGLLGMIFGALVVINNTLADIKREVRKRTGA